MTPRTRKAAQPGRIAHLPRRLALLLSLVALSLPATAPAATGAESRARVASDRCAFADALPTELTVQQLRAGTLCLINAQRSVRGRHALRAHAALARGASRYARQMARERFFAHTSPGGSTLVSRLRATGYLRGVDSWYGGENIAWGTGALSTPRATVQAWMDSPPHRAMILQPHFTEAGIGLAAGGASHAVNPQGLGSTYVVDFGHRSDR